MRKILAIILLFLPHNIAYDKLYFKSDINIWYRYFEAKIINEIKFFEGFSDKPYKDSKGINTIGYGLTNSNFSKITKIQADSMIKVKLNEFKTLSKKHFAFDSDIKHLTVAYIAYCFGFKRILNEKFIVNNQLDFYRFLKFSYHKGKFNKRMYKQRLNQVIYFYF